MDTQKGPLSDFRVLELGNLIAAPYAGRLFAEFGADVIKVERPRTGDELRQWRLFRGNTSLFWSLQARNKRSITLDLRTPEGQEIVLKLLPHVDADAAALVRAALDRGRTHRLSFGRAGRTRRRRRSGCRG